jgi:hypothetical protein
MAKYMTIRVLIALFALSANALFAQGTFHWTWTPQSETPFQCSFDTTWDEAVNWTSWDHDPFIQNSFRGTDVFGVTLTWGDVEVDVYGGSGLPPGYPVQPYFHIDVRDWRGGRYTYISINQDGTISQRDMAYPYASQGSAIGSWNRVFVPEPNFPVLLMLGGLAFWVRRRILVNRRVPL